MGEMVEKNHGFGLYETTPELVFSQLVHSLGAPALRAMFDDAVMEANCGKGGISISDEDERAWQLDIDPEHEVTFFYFGWGPFSLPYEYVDSFVERQIELREGRAQRSYSDKNATPLHVSEALMRWLDELDDELVEELDVIDEADPGLIGQPQEHAKRLAEAARIAGQRELIHRIITQVPNKKNQPSIDPEA